MRSHGRMSTCIRCLLLLILGNFLFITFLKHQFLHDSSTLISTPPPLSFKRPVGTNSLKGIDPLLYDTGPPPGKLWYPGERDLANATLLALVRNSEADAMVQSMLDLERVFNGKFNYPWTFLNDQPFDDEFKRKTRAATKAKIAYETISSEHWAIPSHINLDRMNTSIHHLEDLGVQYSTTLSYHQMCRYNSGLFPLHPALLKYRYYWRVEPNVHFYCNLPYDPFHFLADRNLLYGFVIALYDSPPSVKTLWPEVLSFLRSYPLEEGNESKTTHFTESFNSNYLMHLPYDPTSLIHPNSATGFLTDSYYRPMHTNNASGYSTCHFWSNFEIGDLDFFRSPLYQAYFRHLDRSGGFFYERWGDAPVHSIALGLFADKQRIHWFRDIAYEHAPYFNCPLVDSSGAVCGGEGGAKFKDQEGNEVGGERCKAGRFTNGDPSIEEEDCRANWFYYSGMN